MRFCRPSFSEAGEYPRPDTGEHTEHGYPPAALQTSSWRSAWANEEKDPSFDSSAVERIVGVE